MKKEVSQYLRTQNNNNMKSLQIQRVDLNKNAYGANDYIPSLTSFNDLTDVNEVHSIYVYFETKEEAVQFSMNFPKSYKGSVCTISKPIINDNEVTYDESFAVSFYFNTFHTNETTGSVNESAVNRRIKVIKKLQSII